MPTWTRPAKPRWSRPQSMKAKGKTVVLITHRPGVLAVADRLLFPAGWSRPGRRSARRGAGRAAGRQSPSRPPRPQMWPYRPESGFKSILLLSLSWLLQICFKLNSSTSGGADPTERHRRDGQTRTQGPRGGPVALACGPWVWALVVSTNGLALLDEGVLAQGMVTIDTKSKLAVQHLSGGIIKEVLVKEGQQVKEGQLLLKLDEAAACAITKQPGNATWDCGHGRTLIGRAAQLGQDHLASGLCADVMADPDSPETVMTQEQLFDLRRASLRADLQSIEESIQGQEGLLQAYNAMIGNPQHPGLC